MINDFFGHIYCLNLDRRPDRWERCQEIFADHGIKDVERFSATDGEIMEHYPDLTWGQAGVIASHRRIFDDAITNGYESILIFEDDVEFEPNFLEVFEHVERECPPWNMLYLGWNDELCGAGGRIQVSEHLLLARNFLALHSLGIHSRMFGVMAEHINYAMPLDMLYTRFNNGANCFAANPRTTYQRHDWSDIQSHYVNYDHMLRDL